MLYSSDVILAALIVVLVLAVFVMIWSGRRMCGDKCIEDVMRDRMQEVKQSVEQLQHAYLSTEKSYRAKNRFMNRMSHDLRTPLNAILGYSALMDMAADDGDKVRRYSRRTYVAAQTLLELINDVLDMGCIESGNLKLVEREFSLQSAFEEVNAAIRPQAEAKHQKFNCYMSYNSNSKMIVGDKQRFCQVLRNILSNAVKFTGEGGSIELVVSVAEAGPSNLHVVYQVKDTGCGMSEAFTEKLFRPFQREDNELNTTMPGTGLGLCIAKSFTELMNGNISVLSKPEYGTTVTVELPLKTVPKDAEGTYAVLNNREELYGIHFLAAEDNESNAEILKEVLTTMGAECTLTENGQEVVDVFCKSVPGTYNAILMDVQMPVMDGYEAASAIRSCKHPDAEDITIIAMTADAFEDDVQRAFESGMNAHVAKPLNIHAFTGIIKTLDLN